MSEEISVETIQKTQKLLGQYVKKPNLSEKLLRKPPFRFLHDVVNAVISNTGFLKGLFSEKELISDNVKDKEGKIAFLTKLIEAVKILSGEPLKVRASKIVAGLEPTQTNLLLQAIANALDKKIDSSEYVQQLKSQKKSSKETKTKENVRQVRNTDTGSKKSDGTPRKRSETHSKSRTSDGTVEEKKKLRRKETDVNKEKEVKKSKVDSNRSVERTENAKVKKDKTPREKRSEKPKEVEKVKEDQKELKITETIKEDENHNEKASELLEETLENVIEKPSTSQEPEPMMEQPVIEEQPLKSPKLSLDIEAKPQIQPQRPVSKTLRPPSVRPSSARPGAPRLRTDINIPMEEVIPMGTVSVIVENYSAKDLDEEEEETVVVQTAMETEPIELSVPSNLPSDKGHLVEQILQQIQQDGGQEPTKSLVDIEWGQNGSRNRNVVLKEIETVKAAIQNFTRAANPLGRLINYLHEDIETMLTEIDKWITLKKQISGEILMEKRTTSEYNGNLQAKLVEIDDSIQQYSNMILNLNSNILQNEGQIQSLLAK